MSRATAFGRSLSMSSGSDAAVGQRSVALVGTPKGPGYLEDHGT